MGETTPDASPKGRRYANKSAKPPNALAPQDRAASPLRFVFS
ncbi:MULTISPECIES: hypothetical protein [unclassified Nostoc]|nr:hypothetical protein [Nostoc sp. S13]MDF5738631.1 hypothetical protein [Nostoc sp. S13]MDF5739852.1 hypothetical protein [Nostoc sp. S13]